MEKEEDIAWAKLTILLDQSFLYDYDERFFKGWHLDISWILCTVSWSILVTTAAGIIGAVIYLPEEGGYELIPGEY